MKKARRRRQEMSESVDILLAHDCRLRDLIRSVLTCARNLITRPRPKRPGGQVLKWAPFVCLFVCFVLFLFFVFFWGGVELLRWVGTSSMHIIVYHYQYLHSQR